MKKTPKKPPREQRLTKIRRDAISPEDAPRALSGIADAFAIVAQAHPTAGVSFQLTDEGRSLHTSLSVPVSVVAHCLAMLAALDGIFYAVRDFQAPESRALAGEADRVRCRTANELNHHRRRFEDDKIYLPDRLRRQVIEAYGTIIGGRIDAAVERALKAKFARHPHWFTKRVAEQLGLVEKAPRVRPTPKTAPTTKTAKPSRSKA